MKILPRSILLLFVFFAIPVAYGQTPKGVAGVAVTIKQNPNKRAVTDARGAFAFEGLAPGSIKVEGVSHPEYPQHHGPGK